ncbi:MAG TPA: hypothetical protein VK468_02435 [Pyrinomonadaceae bacterium]|nr:hypothetical protein [Pyrinomonadaceae bacterium]
MSDVSSKETWQVEVEGKLYEAPFDELPEWIAEGSLQPEDKVRKGKLRWIEAQKVPTLALLFDAKRTGKTLPVRAPVPVESAITEIPIELTAEPARIESVIPKPAPPKPVESVRAAARHLETVSSDVCSIHGDAPSAFHCEGCGHDFCKACPHSYGGTVKICPHCGAMCKPIGAMKAAKQAEKKNSAEMSSGFGFGDFARAFLHPFDFKTSLFFGALMFMAFRLGQSASAMGGIFMIVAALFCVLLANMLTFGVLANTVDKFSRGELNENFMPAFEDFSIWEDVVHPFFLSIGAYISSFGPLAVVFIIGFYMITTAMASQMNAFQARVEKIPGTQYYAAKDTVKQSDEVKSLLADVKRQNDERIEQQNNVAAGNTIQVTGQESRDQEALWRQAQESQKASLESVVGKTAETRNKENREMIQGLLGLSPVLVVIGILALLWGLFYFPAACAVAGYTRSFFAAINPLVGLDTIRRLGGSYVKILLMCLVLAILSGVVGIVAGTLFSAFDLPGMGNLPATAVNSLFGFYIWIVFSCILGYALFKASDRLDIRK